VVSVSASICIDAPADAVWERLARLEDITLWSEPVIAARCEPGRSRGVGAERSCDLRGGMTIHERWLFWDEGRSFVYEGSGIPLVARARNEWIVSQVGDKTLLSSHARVTLKGGRLARLLDPLVAYQSRRMGRLALAAFKFLVETGGPPAVKHARLPAGPTGC
jgi:hypothetical protein